MKKVEITVALSVYDGVEAGPLKLAIDSVLKQKGPSFEFCIVMDGITRDDLRSILYDLVASDQRVCLIEFEVNRKLPAAMNAIVKRMKGEFLIRMDADDISFPERFSKLHQYMIENPDIDAAGSASLEFSGDDPATGIYRAYPLTHDLIVEKFNYNNPFCHPAMIFRRRFFDLGLYPHWTLNEDTLLFLNALSGGARFGNISDALYGHRYDADVSRRRQNYRRSVFVWQDRCRVIEKCGGGFHAKLYAFGVMCFQIFGGPAYPILRRYSLKRPTT